MDTITQMLFGGAVAQAGFRKLLGRRATMAGALIGLVPDLDVVTGWINNEDAAIGWLHHRGPSHAIPMTLIYGAALGWAAWRIERSRRNGGALPGNDDGRRRTAWLWLGALCAATHPLIDLFTAYGTQLLAPFSDVRFAINAMPIIDPLYSLPLLVVFILGLVQRKVRPAQVLSQLALVWVALYTLVGWGTGLIMETRAREELAVSAPGNHGIDPHAVSITAYPTLLQPFWRRIVADTEDEILVGFASLFDPRPIAWKRYSRTPQTPALRAARDSETARVFRWFAMGKLHWTVTAAPDGSGHVVEARDYRYGLPGGSELGFWGLRFRLDAENRLLGMPERFSERPEPSENGFRMMWDGLWGR